MKARVKWLEGMRFVGEAGSGHCVVMDGPPEEGGRNLGVRPMEMLLLGLGGCAAFDVVLILKRARQAVTDCQVVIEAQRSDSVPKVFTRIHVTFEVSGNRLSDKHVSRAVELSSGKYCSVSKMLEHTAEMIYSYDIIQSEE